jgi:putative hydrolase of the HAD superfamily
MDVDGVLFDPAIFLRAANRVGVTAARACHVGDHPVVDVWGARSAGLRTIWKRVDYWTPPAETVPTIDRLEQLLLLLS